MRNLDFFKEIEHADLPWGERFIQVPLFYYDTMRLDTLFPVPSEKLKAILPSPRMHPIRVMPGRGILSISAMEFRDTDLGPYNEVSIGVPFTMDTPTPLFTGILRKGPPEPSIYIHHLPLTTGIARDAGVEFAGYPKFLAEIEFENREDWITCRLAEGGRHILTLAGRRLPTRPSPRIRVHFFTARGGRLLRSEGISSERPLARSKDKAHVRFELGDHPIGAELRELGIGRPSVYQYIPKYQTILSPALESFAV